MKTRMAGAGWLAAIGLMAAFGAIWWATGPDGGPPATRTPLPAATAVVRWREREVVVTATAAPRPTRAPEATYEWPTPTPGDWVGSTEIGG